MKPTFPQLDDQLRRGLLFAICDSPGQEICGFLVELGQTLSFRRIPNLGGAGEFWIDQVSLDRILAHIARSEGKVRGFVHSHGQDTNLSFADKSSIRSSPWPWLVIVARGAAIDGMWFWTEVNGVRSRRVAKGLS